MKALNRKHRVPNLSRRREQGIALAMVMISIFLLSVLAAAFAFSMKVETKLAINAKNEDNEVWLGRSGIELARALLAQEMSCPYSSLNQRWAGGGGDDCETNTAAADISSLESYQIGDRTISVKITDLERKANINAAAGMLDQTMLIQALTEVGVNDASEAQAVSSCIQDWVSAGDRTSVNGAKSDYYQSLSPPYVAKNGPIDDLSELLLIKGIRDHPEIYSPDYRPASFLANDRTGRPVDDETKHVYLVDLFTPISSGKININTAPAEVLQLIPGLDENDAASLVAQRAQAPFNRPEDAAVAIPGPKMPALMRWAVVKSTTWEIEVTVAGSPRKFFGVVRTNSPRDIPVLLFYWKDS